MYFCITLARTTCISTDTEGDPQPHVIQSVSRDMVITARDDFLDRCVKRSSYKHVSQCERFQSYDRLELRIDGKEHRKDME